MKKGILAVISALLGAAAGAAGMKRAAKKKEAELKQYADKHLALYMLMNQWVKVKQENKDISAYLIKQGYKKIAIYGMNYVGETLLNELDGSEIEAVYAIDKNSDKIFASIDVLSPDDSLPEVDAVIVTPIFFFDEIEEVLVTKTEADILSIEDILYEV